MYVNETGKIEKKTNWKITASNGISKTFFCFLDYPFYWVEMIKRNLNPLLLKDMYKLFPRMNHKIIFTFAGL